MYILNFFVNYKQEISYVKYLQKVLFKSSEKKKYFINDDINKIKYNYVNVHCDIYLATGCCYGRYLNYVLFCFEENRQDVIKVY